MPTARNNRYQTESRERALHLATVALLDAVEQLLSARHEQHRAVPGLEIDLVNVAGKTKRLRELLPHTDVAAPAPKVVSLSLFDPEGW